MTNHLTEIVFILDRSGSMSGLESDTIGGFNAMLRKQKALAVGDAYVSTVVFNHASHVIHDRVPIERVPDMTPDDYYVGGSTALYDALGDAIHHIEVIHKYARPEDVPKRTLFIITTDGMENASRRYNRPEIKRMIQRQKTRYDWEFLFLGANIDAVEAAGDIGIAPNRAVNYRCDPMGTALNYDVLNDVVSCVRACPTGLSDDWADRIDADFENRRE